MSQIITKDFHGSNLRIILIEDKEWFFAKDVAELLGYSNPQKAIRDHCNNQSTFQDFFKVNESFTLDLQPILGNSWKQNKIIPESDVWRLIIKSKLPEAEKVENWIMETVLPQIRKTGSYQTQKESPQQKLEKFRFATELYGLTETVFKKFGNLSKKELAIKTSKVVTENTGIDFLEMFGEFPKKKSLVLKTVSH